MLLLCDRGFFSYNLWKTVISQGVHILARVIKSMILKPIEQLSDGSYLAKIYRNAYDREKDRNGIRGARDQVHDGRSATRRAIKKSIRCSPICWTKTSIPLGS